VRIAIFADIHANREAFAACLAHAHDRGATPTILLGDYVGYGADPKWSVTTVMDLVYKGAIAVRGNHDDALANPRDTMNAQARAAIEWTRDELVAADRNRRRSPLRPFRCKLSECLALCRWRRRR